jgi:hypothetical protein
MKILAVFLTSLLLAEAIFKRVVVFTFWVFCGAITVEFWRLSIRSIYRGIRVKFVPVENQRHVA